MKEKELFVGRCGPKPGSGGEERIGTSPCTYYGKRGSLSAGLKINRQPFTTRRPLAGEVKIGGTPPRPNETKWEARKRDWYYRLHGSGAKVFKRSGRDRQHIAAKEASQRRFRGRSARKNQGTRKPVASHRSKG